MTPWWLPCSPSSQSNAAQHWCAFAMRCRGLHPLTILKAARSPSCCRAGSAHTVRRARHQALCETCGVEAKSRSRTDSRPSHRGAAEKTREKQIPILRGSARETLARRGRLDPGDLHDDRRLLELMERRRRVQHPLQGLDQFRYHNAVVPHLDDLRLGREPRDGEARHSGARARGRDDPWCKPALGRGVGGRCFMAFWLFEPCCILGLDGSRGGPAPLANRLDAAFEPCGTHQRSHDRSGAAAAQ